MELSTIARAAEQVIETLVDYGPATAEELCERTGWSRSRLAAAIKHAREHLCGEIGISIPAPTPGGGWRYEATTDWQLVEQGASYVLGSVEGRLRNIQRDISIVRPHLQRGTIEWRRASFLDKHLSHIIGTLGEIDGSR